MSKFLRVFNSLLFKLGLDQEIQKGLEEDDIKKYQLNLDYGTCDFELGLINGN